MSSGEVDKMGSLNHVISSVSSLDCSFGSPCRRGLERRKLSSSDQITWTISLTFYLNIYVPNKYNHFHVLTFT